MALVTLKDRVAALEAEVACLKVRLEASSKNSRDWLDRIWGSFANDPIYDEAMRLGKKYRESLRPKPPKYIRSRVDKTEQAGQRKAHSGKEMQDYGHRISR